MTTTTFDCAFMAHPPWAAPSWRIYGRAAAHPDELIAEPALPDTRSARGEPVHGVEETTVEARRDDLRQRYRRDDQLLDVEPGVAEEPEEAPAREEAQVGAVEDAAIAIVPATEEK